MGAPQKIYRTKNRFQNPLHQNHLHVKALMAFLNLPEHAFHSLVFCIGGAEFKTPMPGNVINHGLRSWIEKHSSPRLESLCKSTDRKAAARNHVIALNARIA